MNLVTAAVVAGLVLLALLGLVVLALVSRDSPHGYGLVFSVVGAVLLLPLLSVSAAAVALLARGRSMGFAANMLSGLLCGVVAAMVSPPTATDALEVGVTLGFAVAGTLLAAAGVWGLVSSRTVTPGR